ncbi:MAG: hypothetical protein DRP47_12200 [Candidatus Zixiibacteriota bacterium]|nr:MAG: hypothetical protein DRP47_12200 [candidate division Zixibacteria bacterium]
MHPSQKELSQFVEGKLNPQSASRIEKHIEICEFCRDFINDYRLNAKLLAETAAETVPPEAMAHAERLYNQAITGRTIPITTLLERESQASTALAADGDKEFSPSVQNLMTLCSEDPEIVLRVMRDHSQNQDYLQLISDNPLMTANVLVQIPELSLQYVTNSDGKAELDKTFDDSIEKLKWQIKLPDVVYDLEPLVYDPDKTEYAEDVELKTDRDDRIRVTFEGKTEGKQISIEILALDGRDDFGEVIVAITQKSQPQSVAARLQKPVTFDLVDNDSTINIRLFQTQEE